MLLRTVRIALACAPLAFCPRIARAEPLQQTIAVSIAGGGSLGAYEAGYLHQLNETLRSRPDIARIRVATGTSAGSMNALLLLIASCTPRPPSPEQSAFYTTWTRSTFRNLFVRSEVQRLGMFSRQTLFQIWDEFETSVDATLNPSCDVLLGIPATRVDPFSLTLPGSVAGLPRSEETFVVRIEGRDGGGPARVHNFVDRRRSVLPALLPVDGDDRDELRFVRDVAFASSSYPFAFSPTEVRLCMGGERCLEENSIGVDFVDGGILDNAPLRLAATIARTGLEDGESGGAARIRVEPDATQRIIRDDTHLVLLDPDVTLYPPEPTEGRREGSGALELYLGAIDHVVDSARSSELTTLFESYPEIIPHVGVAHVYLPPTANLLGGFFGLFDEQFLAFDFALGVVDARRQFDGVVRRPLEAAADANLVFDVPTWDEDSTVSRAARCIYAVLESSDDATRLCEGAELAPTRALLQLAIARLYAHCLELPEGTNTGHPICVRAMDGEPVMRVPFVSARTLEEHPIGDHDSVAEAVELLDALGFVFRDLGLEAHQGHRALLRIRERVADAAGTFVSEQPSLRQLLDVIIRYISNEIVYTPPRAIGHATIGRQLELGASIGAPYSRLRWARATVGLALSGLESIASSDRSSIGLGIAAGVEFEPLFLSGPLVQLRLGTRFGYSFGTLDHFGAERCPNDVDARFCSRAYIDSYLAGAFLDVLRIQLSAYVYPAWGRSRELDFFVGPSFGIELRSRR